MLLWRWKNTELSASLCMCPNMQALIDKCGKNPDAIKWVFCGMADVFVANKLTTEMKSLRGIQGRLAGSRGKGIADFMVMRLNLRDYIVNKIPWRVRG